MDGCPSWTGESEEDPRGDSEWRPKPSRRIREDGANFTLLPSAPGGPAPFCPRAAGGPRTPGRACDCCSAAFLTGHPLLTGPQLRAANPELGSANPELGSIFSAAVSSGSRSSACTQGDGASPPGNLPAFRSPPPRFPPGPAPGLVAAERLLPMGALVPLRH